MLNYNLKTKKDINRFYEILNAYNLDFTENKGNFIINSSLKEEQENYINHFIDAANSPKNFPYKRLNDLLKQYNTSFTSTTLVDNKYISYAFKLNNECIHVVKLENNKYMIAILKHIKEKENFYKFVPGQIIKTDLNFYELKNELINILM